MKNYKLVIGAIVLIAIGYGACYFLTPPTVTMDDYVLLNQDFVDRLREANCYEETLEVRKELDGQFQIALNERDIQCQNWNVCPEDCTDNPIIIKSNCDTTFLDEQIVYLEDSLEECIDAYEVCDKQRLNLQYK